MENNTKVEVKLLSRVRLFATPWTVAYQAPPWNFPGQSTGVGCCFLLQGIFLTQGSNPGLLQAVSCIAGRFFTNWATIYIYFWSVLYYGGFETSTEVGRIVLYNSTHTPASKIVSFLLFLIRLSPFTFFSFSFFAGVFFFFFFKANPRHYIISL